jgi:hypothetical protein
MPNTPRPQFTSLNASSVQASATLGSELLAMCRAVRGESRHQHQVFGSLFERHLVPDGDGEHVAAVVQRGDARVGDIHDGRVVRQVGVARLVRGGLDVPVELAVGHLRGAVDLDAVDPGHHAVIVIQSQM